MMATKKQPQLVLRRDIPPELFAYFVPLLAIARNCGVGITGTRGIGKSTLEMLFAWLDAVFFDTAMIVIDPVGGVINRFFSYLTCFRERDQEALWPTILYLNLSGQDVAHEDGTIERYVVPTPIYYRTGIGDESAFAISQRFPACIARLDPQLITASQQGFNSLWDASLAAGQILAALNLQITEMAELLRDYHTPLWQQRLRQALALDPSIADAVAFFTNANEFPSWKTDRIASLKTKLRLFTSDTMKAQFGASLPGIDLFDVMMRRGKVFIDVSTEHDPITRQFKMLWVFMWIMDFIRRFGPTYGMTRQYPLSLIIDEITFMTNDQAARQNPLVSDLDSLINQLSRNFDTRIVTSFQEPFQIPDERLRKSIMSLATNFYGRLSDPDSSRLLADRAIPYQPHLIKQTIVTETTMGAQYRDELFSIPEQRELGRQLFDNLDRYHYLVSRTVKEGDKPLPLHPFSIEPFAGIVNHRPNLAIIDAVKQQLSRRDGRAVSDILTEINRRCAPVPSTVPPATFPGASRPASGPSLPFQPSVRRPKPSRAPLPDSTVDTKP